MKKSRVRSCSKKNTAQGLTLVEFLIATFIGIILSLALLKLFYTQIQIYKTGTAQTHIQTAHNALTYLVLPSIRNAGFLGCSTISTAVSTLNGGGAKPLGTFNAAPTLIMGYSGGTGGINIASNNPTNDSNINDWTPALDVSLAGQVQKWNDVLIVLGPTPGSFPVSISTIALGSNSLTVSSLSGMSITAGNFGAVSDCAKSSIFQITGVSGTNIVHNAGGGAFGNASSNFSINYNPGAQFMPIQQTAFFVGQGHGDQSALMYAVQNGNTWSVQPIIPGVSLMKVLYGIGSNGVVSQYVTAGNVTNWANVYAVKIGFLLEGDASSGSSGGNPTQFSVLGIPVTMPVDNRIRHSTEMTISLRNAGL